MKYHSKDYLLELANNSDTNVWLKMLIYETINTNANISNEFFGNIYKNIIKNEIFDYKIPNNEIQTEKNILKLVYLNHKKGVNALSSNQIINFSNDITILHGLNGAGKSGYFKILNEITGGKQEKKIISNIYKKEEEKENIDVEIKFKIGRSEKIVNWDGNSRDLENLNSSKVFDSSYLNGLLTKRESDETLIQPFGLHFFEYIVKNIDGLKNKIKNDYELLNAKKPNINLDGLSQEIKNIFINNKLDKNSKDKLEKLFIFTKEDEEKLTKIISQIKILNQENINDKIKIETRKKEDIEKFRQDLINIFTSLKSTGEKIPDLINNYNSELEKSLKIKNQIEVLKDIPQSNTETWKNFIKAGDEYSKKIDSKLEICPYCFQTLKDNSLEIVKSYTIFLNNNSEQKLLNLTQAIKNILEKNKLINTEIVINEDLKNILLSSNIKNEELGETKSLYCILSEILDYFKNKKSEFISNLEAKNIIYSCDFSLNGIDIRENLKSIKENQEEIIKELTINQGEKNKKISELETEKGKLTENKNISNQQLLISDWIKIDDEIILMKEKESQIKTNKISTLSSQAHNELLTENLKTIFTNELKGFGLNLDVSLEKVSSSKGKSQTELFISKNHSVNTILSEGEQKAVALALFISESKISKINAPIIFDDPINSLDHKIALNFTERLILLENQIIIFNHNKLFIDTFETLKENHICKNINGGCSNSKGKHIVIYEVASEGINNKGVLKNYKSNNLKSNLEEIEQLLKKSPFDEHEKVSALLRKTIECYIDEKILNNIIPSKYSNKNSRINWDGLKEISINNSIIDELKKMHSRLSGGKLHNGTESDENPMELDDYKKIVDFLN